MKCQKDIKILFLEPHVDDFELGFSVYLEHLINFLNKDEINSVRIDIALFCNGARGKDNFQNRFQKRSSNLETWRNLTSSKNFTINVLPIFPTKILDTQLEVKRHFNRAVEKLLELENEHKYTHLFIPQKDLHRDHRMVNEIGMVISRGSAKFPIVKEYLIMNSFPETQYDIVPKWNTEFRLVSPKITSIGSSIRAISVCEYENEITTEQIMKQKFHNNAIVDRFNLIKSIDIFWGI